MGNWIITLDSGQELKLEGFNIAHTYSGVIIGGNNEELNNDILSRISYPTDWGTRNSKYNRESLYQSDGQLQPFHYSVWLTCDTPIGDDKNEFIGSEVVVNWFGQAIGNKGLKDFIKEGLIGFDWDKLAINYQL